MKLKKKKYLTEQLEDTFTCTIFNYKLSFYRKIV